VRQAVWSRGHALLDKRPLQGWIPLVRSEPLVLLNSKTYAFITGSREERSVRLDIETRRCDHAVALDMQPPVALVSVLQPRYIPAFPRSRFAARSRIRAGTWAIA
jgi:hypothetical protein